MFLHTHPSLAVDSLYRHPVRRYLVVRRNGDRHKVWWDRASILCKWRVVCSVQHSLSSPAFCAMHCAAQPGQPSVLCTALCSTVCPVQRSVQCTVQHSLSTTAFCVLHCAAQPAQSSVLCTAPIVAAYGGG